MPGEGVGERSLAENIRNLVLDLINLKRYVRYLSEDTKKTIRCASLEFRREFHMDRREPQEKVSMDREENRLWTLQH